MNFVKFLRILFTEHLRATVSGLIRFIIGFDLTVMGDYYEAFENNVKIHLLAS